MTRPLSDTHPAACECKRCKAGTEVPADFDWEAGDTPAWVSPVLDCLLGVAIVYTAWAILWGWWPWG